MRLVVTAREAIEGIRRLQAEVARAPALADRLGLAHAYYIDDHDPDRPLFGFSKWIGYWGLTAETYLATYEALNGRNTEWALREFFIELHPGTPDYRAYHARLTDWLAQFGKAPRKKVRLMALKPEFREAAPAGEDRRLLDLMIAVADLLPIEQRLALRERL